MGNSYFEEILLENNMSRVLYLGWFILGLVQFFAIVTGFVNSLGSFFGIIAAFILAEIPVLGTIMGIRGAVNNWGWSFLGAILLFVVAPIACIALSALLDRDR
jgi:hypothetical protein